MSKTIMQRLQKGEDLVAELTRVCRENNITRGAVQVIGAMEQARLGYYHQDARTYETHAIDQHVEILAGIGNVSLLDGEAFVHLHLTLGDSTCRCMGGHAMEGNIIFAAEAIITEIPGDTLSRTFDEPTGLKLWA
ncbi:DUF296 domain-containing protein [Pseudodesulfovibrio sp. F-1]|uniref:DUF296 domain-containing protein n=1 Tax=Pseudodesulfovibrio alkaliphilus TaxID=2661613 RepID=A0A7K1KS38_9BACT|nr:PPC domain-containing DNA-binding protein [Pseudodesulfovibrio alkaliphilus]MUM78701.1 DUF296 domain-containing protein [Pseudodesulfovibrio alkaliphilus]